MAAHGHFLDNGMKRREGLAREIAAVAAQEPGSKRDHIGGLEFGQGLFPAIRLHDVRAALICLESISGHGVTAVAPLLQADIQPAVDRLRDGTNGKVEGAGMGGCALPIAKGAGLLQCVERGVGVAGFGCLAGVADLIGCSLFSCSFSYI